ncbi:MAG: hypothetical protein HYU81_02075 [Candidatus Brennerbacteria bacterium]|nr:hypothetical protein [Candidatus Brennerbacteria bacterium]
MTQEVLATELLSMRKRAERTAQSIDQISHNLSAERQSLRQVVKEYGTKRVELLKQELQARGVTWCTYCSAVIPESDAELLLVEGREEYSHGYGNACYGFRGFSKLHRACPTCRERAADKHGQKGSYDSQAKDQSSFYAFRVEKRDDGYYARKFGNWVKLDDENCKLNEPSSQLVEKLAEGWNLPPRIEVESRWPSSEEKLIVHERVLAEAS